MIRLIAPVLGVFALGVIWAAPSAAADPYLDDVSSAATYIQQGDYDRAVSSINSALVRRSGDPLVHLALGIVFLHTRQPEAALAQFSTVQSLSKDDPLAAYGLGIYHLAKGRKGSARNCFEQASADGVYDVAPALFYLSALSGSYPQEAASMSDPVAAQTAAQRHFNARSYEESARILSVMVGNRRGFEEEIGAVVTFDPSRPIHFTGRPLARPYKSPSEAEPGLKKFKGTVTLKADLTRTRGISYVAFYVDDKMIGLINRSPYECRWDTTDYANAPHTVRIQGIGPNGAAISEKSVRVMVGNENVPSGGPLPEEEVRAVRDRLLECLRLKPSFRLAYYTLAKIAEAQRDREKLLSAIEHVVAIDPNYKDARRLLIQHYAPIQEYRGVWRVDIREKIAAVTFDDGPNPNSTKILDILAEKGVKATFFVVGQMAEANPGILRRMASEGHEIGMSTYADRSLRYLPDVEIEKELVRTATVIRDITGRSSRFFRPPGDRGSDNPPSAAGRLGYRAIFWTVNCSKNEGKKPLDMLSTVSRKTVPGSIIRMHSGDDATLQALAKIIDMLRSKGYRLVTLSELLAAGRPAAGPGK